MNLAAALFHIFGIALLIGLVQFVLMALGMWALSFIGIDPFDLRGKYARTSSNCTISFTIFRMKP